MPKSFGNTTPHILDVHAFLLCVSRTFLIVIRAVIHVQNHPRVLLICLFPRLKCFCARRCAEIMPIEFLVRQYVHTGKSIPFRIRQLALCDWIHAATQDKQATVFELHLLRLFYA